MAAEKWLEREIATGFKKLLALRLPGAPSQDTINDTLDVWIDALTAPGQDWKEPRDVPRIRAAFTSLLRSSTQWPVPKQFLDHLPRNTTSPKAPEKTPPPPREVKENRRAQLWAAIGQVAKSINFNNGNQGGSDG